jgi:DNA-binding response OmpR family regulator
MKPIEVILVEDDVAEAHLIGKILRESALPVNLHIARDGMEALFTLANGAFQPDVVIVDLNIPYISGHGVIERFHPKDVPVVAFSSSLNEADKQRALQMGAREYVRKPTDLRTYTDAVLSIVEKWALRRPKETRQQGVSTPDDSPGGPNVPFLVRHSSQKRTRDE